LRPQASDEHTLLIYDENNNESFESYFNSDLDYLRDLKKDFSIIALDKKNYNVVKKINGKKFEIVIYDLLNKPLFKSSNSFVNEAEAKAEIPMIIQFFRSIIDKNQIEDYSQIKVLNDLSNQFPDDFTYSNHINFVFPNWPLRFQNKEFRNLINQILEENIPAHLTYDTFYLDIDQINNFEQTFRKWLNLKKSNNQDKLDLESLQIIQLLMNYKKNEK
jgi:hypothetical protein